MLKAHYHASLAEEETQVLQRSGDYQGEDNDSLFLPFFRQHLFQSTERQCQHTETHFWGVINQRNEVGVGGDSKTHMNFSKTYCKYCIVKIGLKQHDYINYIKLDLTFIYFCFKTSKWHNHPLEEDVPCILLTGTPVSLISSSNVISEKKWNIYESWDW